MSTSQSFNNNQESQLTKLGKRDTLVTHPAGEAPSWATRTPEKAHVVDGKWRRTGYVLIGQDPAYRQVLLSCHSEVEYFRLSRLGASGTWEIYGGDNSHLQEGQLMLLVL